MSKRVWIFVAAVLLFELLILELTVGISLPSIDRASATSRVAIKIVGTGLHFVTENKRFHAVDYLEGNVRTTLILRESVALDRETDVEGSGRGLVTVEAFENTVTNRPKWKIQQEGHVGEMFGDVLYKITKRGCCDAPTMYMYFSLRDGKKLYEGSHDLTPAELAKFY